MTEDRIVATNRRARHEYEILETFEAGLVLRGTEVKSLRTGQVNFKDSYATVREWRGAGCSAATSALTATAPTPTTTRSGTESSSCTAARSGGWSARSPSGG